MCVQGYQYESDVVWEQLATVDGDTQFVDSEFRPFQPHAAAVAAEPGNAPAAEFEPQGRSTGVYCEGKWVLGVDLWERGLCACRQGWCTATVGRNC